MSFFQDAGLAAFKSRQAQEVLKEERDFGIAERERQQAQMNQALLGSQPQPGAQGPQQNEGGLLNNPYDPQAIINYQNQALLAGVPNEVANQQVKAAQRVGSFDTQNQQLQAYSTLGDKHEKNIAKPRAVLETYQGANDLLKERGSFEALTPADDLALISAFAQIQRPGEAMMEGDVVNIMKTAGLWDQVKASFSSGGATALEPSVRKKIFKTMTTMAKTQDKRYGEIRAQTQKRFEQSGFAGLDSPMRGKMEFNPYTPATKPRSQWTEAEFNAAKARGEI